MGSICRSSSVANEPTASAESNAERRNQESRLRSCQVTKVAMASTTLQPIRVATGATKGFTIVSVRLVSWKKPSTMPPFSSTAP